MQKRSKQQCVSSMAAHSGDDTHFVKCANSGLAYNGEPFSQAEADIDVCEKLKPERAGDSGAMVVDAGVPVKDAVVVELRVVGESGTCADGGDSKSESSMAVSSLMLYSGTSAGTASVASVVSLSASNELGANPACGAVFSLQMHRESLNVLVVSQINQFRIRQHPPPHEFVRQPAVVRGCATKGMA